MSDSNRPSCPAYLPSISCDQASRTLGSPLHGSVGYGHAASSADGRSHSAADRWRSSADEAASAVQNVAAASIFLLSVVIKKKKNKGKKDRILKKGRRREGLPLYPPLRLIVVC